MNGHLQGKKIVVVDDEFGARKLLDMAFTRVGAIIHTAADSEEGLKLLEQFSPDLMLVDLMMPQVDGLSLCRQVREFSNVPIIIVTAKNRPEDVIAGLQAGADDYVTKPFETTVLIERAKAVLRRGKGDMQPFREETIEDAYLSINLKDQVVMVNGQPIKLSNTEFDLLAYLARNANHTCTFEHIMKYVWGQERSHRPEYIHVYIWRLRHKLEEDPGNPSYIITDHSSGYRFVFSG